MVSTAYIARPDGGHPLQSTRRGGQTAMLVGKALVDSTRLEKAEKAESRMREGRVAHTTAPESTIAKKEDALECIMSAEANRGFEDMSRYLLNKGHTTRTGVDPTRMPNFNGEPLDAVLSGKDLEDASEACEDMAPDMSLLNRCPLDTWSANAEQWQSGERPPAWASEGLPPGLRLGLGMGDPPKARGKGEDRSPLKGQDRIFAARCGEEYVLVGIVDGHGHPRHSVDLVDKITELMPSAVFQSPRLIQHGDPAGALTWAFHRVHCQAVASGLDVRLAGASCTVALVDRETVWVANVGDCKAVLAVPDHTMNSSSFHFRAHTVTKEHKLSAKAEFDRAHDAGGELRKLANDNVYRLYLPSQELPGLTMTRAIGDRVGHEIGVTHAPSVSRFSRTDVHDDCGKFLVIGSGGVWMNMAERTVVTWVSGHAAAAGASELAQSLSNEAYSRWQDPETWQKVSLRHGLPDCFATVLVFFDPVDSPGEGGGGDVSRDLAQVPRDLVPLRRPPAFVLGPSTNKSAHRDWKEVKARGRTEGLRAPFARFQPM